VRLTAPASAGLIAGDRVTPPRLQQSTRKPFFGASLSTSPGRIVGAAHWRHRELAASRRRRGLRSRNQRRPPGRSGEAAGYRGKSPSWAPAQALEKCLITLRHAAAAWQDQGLLAFGPAARAEDEHRMREDERIVLAGGPLALPVARRWRLAWWLFRRQYLAAMELHLLAPHVSGTPEGRPSLAR